MLEEHYILEDARGNVIIKSTNCDECIRFAKEELEDIPYETFFINKVTTTTVWKVDKDGVKDWG